MLVEVFSNARRKYPACFNCASASLVCLKYSHGTVSSAPSAALRISWRGGTPVMPQRHNLPTPAASALRKIEPTLCRLRMLSSTATNGNWLTVLPIEFCNEKTTPVGELQRKKPHVITLPVRVLLT